jgi:hypothetical protein
MKEIVFNIINGIYELGFGGFISYLIFSLFLFWIIDSKIFYYIESLIKLEHNVYFYDIILLVLFMLLFLYGLFVFGELK